MNKQFQSVDLDHANCADVKMILRWFLKDKVSYLILNLVQTSPVSKLKGLRKGTFP